MEISFQHLNCLYASRCSLVLLSFASSRLVPWRADFFLCFMQTNCHAYTLITMLHMFWSVASWRIYKLRAFLFRTTPTPLGPLPLAGCADLIQFFLFQLREVVLLLI